jgi:tRNA (guanine37-N1)-methyltransferase
MFPGTLGGGVVGRALSNGIWSYKTTNPRDFAKDNHRTVDDAAFGGADGQVMMADPISKAIDSIKKPNAKIIYFSPRGKLWNQKTAREYKTASEFILLCGRYEGVDQRVIDEYEIEEISIGDYILSGGEIAAQVFIDSLIRLCDNVVRGGPDATGNESFEIGGLEWPLYTRPDEWRGRKVPDVLLSGHRGEIEKWKKERSDAITMERRPDLLLKEKGKDNGEHNK